MFRPVSSKLDFVSIEEAVLERWAAHHVFERSVQQRANDRPWIFYEGPPTANNKPGVHHVWARVYKDLFCRYQTMRGRLVERKAGWDTHGLPVEVEVEKRLGISGKRAIEEKVGVARFTELCRDSVHSYVEEFARLTTRIGYWVDMEGAYWTLDPEYVDSVWWHLKSIFDKGLLYEDLKVLPYCPRCETPLSSHELGQPDVYTDEADLTAYVRLPLEAESLPEAPEGVETLLVWTTTPWTLPSNVGAAVDAELTYAAVGGTVVARDLVETVFGEGVVPDATFPGARLVGLRYRRPFTDLEIALGDAGVVVAADFVTADEGTGIVHLAPAFGEVDRIAGKEHGLATLNPVGPDGRFTSAVPWLEGQGVRDTNEHLVAELERRHLLERSEWQDHAVPHCWRCNAVLIYWGKPSWYVATTSYKDELLAQNETIDWHPDYIRDGRFGEWLENNVDWALSRDRYWGTPLPVWRCSDGHLTCVGSRAELAELAGDPGVADIDPHRPAIDAVAFPCPKCTSQATRVAPVIDAWFDAGAMPAAQWGYPYVTGSKERFAYPAEFIAEAIDQTRGWFYTLLAVNVPLFTTSPYRHVLCLGHIVDQDGRKMSKSLGNVMDPWDVLTTRGADPLRWWMFAQGSPWTPTRGSMAAIDATTRELLTLWNTFSFFVTYASVNGFNPTDPAVPAFEQRGELDRWALSRCERTTSEVTEALDGYEPLAAAMAIAGLVDDLSNWYVRRSRRRFWRTDPAAPPSDALAAQATLHEVLVRISLLLAPLCPFLAEHLFTELCAASPEDSVHLCDWPATDVTRVDDALESTMASAREIVSLGRAAREEAGIKVRQPLRRALVFLPPGADHPPAGVVEDELNVDRVEYSAALSDVLAYELRPNFRSVGPKLGERVRLLAGALDALDAAAAARELEDGGTISVTLGDEVVALSGEDVELRVRPERGFAVSRKGAAVVALDLELDDDLLRRGAVRELVRQVQELRKERGLAVSDHVTLWLTGTELREPERELVAREVLADAIHGTSGPGEAASLELADGVVVEVWLAVS